jgi:dTMP kinase
MLRDKLAGKFIAFDGPDGCGKGTQIDMLSQHLQSEGLDVVYGQDPGGTDIGNRIRSILLHDDVLSEMDVRCETFLFMASRAQLVGELIEPAIAAGKVVLCDRFISATCAYQAAAGDDPKRIIELGRFAVGQRWPDLTIILDVPVETSLERRKLRAAAKSGTTQGQDDAMERRPTDFHRRVRDLFLHLPDSYPGRVEVIDGEGPVEAVHQRIRETIERVDF